MTDAQINQAGDLIMFLVTVFLLGAGLLVSLYNRYVDKREKEYVMSRNGSVANDARFVRDDDENTANEPANEPPNLPNLASQSRTDQRNQSFALSLSFEELQAVQRMNMYRSGILTAGQKLTKKESIFAGFGVKSGDSPAYKRASEIYEALYTNPIRGPVFGEPGAYQDKEGRPIPDPIAQHIIRSN